MNELFWLAVLISYGYFYYDIIFSGDIGLYIHPRMHGYAYFAFGVLCLFSIIQLVRVFIYTEEKPARRGYAIFLIPIVLVLLFKPTVLSTRAVASENTDILAKGTNCPTACSIPDASSNDNDDETISELVEVVQADETTCPVEEPGLLEEEICQEEEDIEEEVIDVPEEKVVENINDLLADQGFVSESEQYMELVRLGYEETDVLDNKHATIIGFVLNQEGFEDNQFYVGRMIITCCAACAQPDGFLCVAVESIDIPDDTWVQISGVFHIGPYTSLYGGDEWLLPILNVEDIEYIEPPADPYVYYQWNN